jgi:hypothetical protein
MDLEYGLLVAGLIVGGFIFFFIISKVGERIVIKNDPTKPENTEANESHYNYGMDISE